MNRTLRTGQLRATAAVLVLAGATSACFLAGHPAAAPSGDAASLEARVNAHPADVDAALRLADVYRQAKRMDDARVLLERTTANAPGNDAAAMLLGLAYEDLGRLSDARSLYQRRAGTAGSAAMRRRFLGRMVVVQRLELIAQARDAVAREAVLAQTPPRPGTVAVFPFAFAGDDAQLRPLSRALAE
ncbi:MAG TPA: tetratricopeptide repeat protein, partial [Longimicrobiaceae bacterium]|nr:tetratricopeptide repeat protein [Longimicrobiaceae bacterium]